MDTFTTGICMTAAHRAPARRAHALLAGLAAMAMMALLPGSHALGAGDSGGMVRFDPPQPAPVLELPLLGGGRVTLAQYQGRYVLLNFWATWCLPCLRELPALQDLASTLAPEGLDVLTVALDAGGAGDVQPYARRLNLQLPVALDATGKAGARYGVRDLPLTFLIGPGGKVVAAAKGARVWNGPPMLAQLRDFLKAK